MKIFADKLIYHVFFVISIVFTLGGYGYAQENATRFQHITTEDGLSQNMVDCILQDSQGFMWFGTYDGLNRYDGYTFQVFRNNFKDNFCYYA